MDIGWVLCAAGLASCSHPTPAPAAQSEHRARLTSVEGDVRWKPARANDYSPAARDTVLSIADIVSTGPSGHATIAFDDGSTAMVTPQSLVEIEPPATSAANGLQVQSGRVDIEISSTHSGQFRVCTPDAEAALPARKIDVVGKK